MSKTHKNEIKIEIEDEDMIRLVHDLEGIGEKCAKALTNTVNDMKRRAPAQVRKSVTAEYTISPKEITPGATKKTKGGGTQAVKQAASMRIKGETVAGLRFVYKGRSLTPTHFRMTPTRAPIKKAKEKSRVPGQLVGKGTPFVTMRQPAEYNIKFQIHKGKKKELRGKYDPLPFLAPAAQGSSTMIPFQREGKGRTPVTAIKTTSVPQMIDEPGVRENIQKQLNDLLKVRLKHNAERALKSKG